MTSRAKLNITERLVRNMVTEEKRQVPLMQNTKTLFDVSEISDPSTPYGRAYLTKFKVEWSCHAVVQCNDDSLWQAKERMARHIKNDMYRDVVNELYRIAEELAGLPVESKAFDSVYDLIKELS